MFQAIVQGAPLGVLISDQFGSIVFCNSMAAEILSVAESSVMGHNLNDLVSDQMTKVCRDIVRKTLEADANVFVATSGNGPQKHYEIKLSHAVGHNNDQLNVFTFIDVTTSVQALRSLEGQEQRWDLALQGSRIGVFESDLRTGAGFASQTWYDLLGISKDICSDSDAEWHARVHPDDLAFVIVSDAQCIEGLSEKSEATFRMKVHDGTWRWMKSILRVTERDDTGKAVRLLGTMTDITDEKRVDELKNDFVATVSHELRTPLAAVYGALGLLSGSIGEVAPEKKRKLLDMAERNTARLIKIVDELLDFQKLRAGHFSVSMERLDMGNIVRHVILDNETFAQKFNIDLTLDVPDRRVEVNGDPLRLTQVLTNIVSNAVKFSDYGGSVTVSLSCEASYCMVSIKDNGRGISSDFESRVFEPFSQQADPLTRDKGGSGLGLAISKDLIEIMSGTIEYTSQPNVETTFWITLPLA